MPVWATVGTRFPVSDRPGPWLAVRPIDPDSQSGSLRTIQEFPPHPTQAKSPGHTGPGPILSRLSGRSFGWSGLDRSATPYILGWTESRLCVFLVGQHLCPSTHGYFAVPSYQSHNSKKMGILRTWYRAHLEDGERDAWRDSKWTLNQTQKIYSKTPPQGTWPKTSLFSLFGFTK